MTCSGGGLIQDSEGRFLAGFFENYGFSTNMKAELGALLSGVRLCSALGYSQIEMEGDSSMIINWVQRWSCTVWYKWRFLGGIAFGTFFGYVLSFTLIQGNKSGYRSSSSAR